MEEVINCDVAKELFILLSYCDSEFIKRIPNDFYRKIISLAAESKKEYFINIDKDISEQNISNDCLDLLSELYVYVEENC